MTRELTWLDQIAAIIAGAVLCLVACVVALTISHLASEPDKPWTNEEIMLAVQHCERLGLQTSFDRTITCRVTDAHCGSER